MNMNPYIMQVTAKPWLSKLRYNGLYGHRLNKAYSTSQTFKFNLSETTTIHSDLTGTIVMSSTRFPQHVGLTVDQESSLSAQLDAIFNLPLCQLGDRQPLLVSLLAEVVDIMTDGGDRTDSGEFAKSQEYFSDLNDVATALGFTFIGAGYFSLVFKHHMLPARVIKVGLKKEDSGAAYAAWCRANQGKAGVPTIHSINRFRACYTVVMDYLKPYRTTGANASAYDTGMAYVVVCNILMSSKVTKLTSLIPIAETAMSIKEFFQGVATFDVHEDNVMVDSRGNLVITDPVSFTDDGLQESFMDFEGLCQEVETIKKATLIAKWRKRHEWKHGKKAESRRALRLRRKRVASARRERDKAVKLIAGMLPCNFVHEMDVKGVEKILKNEIAEVAGKAVDDGIYDLIRNGWV